MGGEIAPPTLTREDSMLENNYVWTCFIRKADAQHLSDDELKEMTSELQMAVQAICFTHGIHN